MFIAQIGEKQTALESLLDIYVPHTRPQKCFSQRDWLFFYRIDNLSLGFLLLQIQFRNSSLVFRKNEGGGANGIN